MVRQVMPALGVGSSAIVLLSFQLGGRRLAALLGKAAVVKLADHHGGRPSRTSTFARSFVRSHRGHRGCLLWQRSRLAAAAFFGRCAGCAVARVARRAR